MSAAAQSVDSAAHRALQLRMRPDLIVRGQRAGRQRTLVVKDPVSLQYSQLREEEYFILEKLDGQTSLTEIKRQFDRRFAPRTLPIERLHAFIAQLYDNGLLLADAAGQGEQLVERFGRRRRSAWLQQWGSILAIRFRGVDPQRLLDWLYPKCRFFFTRAALVMSVGLAVAALLLWLLRFEALNAKLPGFSTFFSVENMFWLAVALGVVKVLHELGHGMTCRHFGGECHEIGVMFLVFTPCLYCNVSDAWMLPNKWNRIAIGAAGIYVEILMASICTFLWAFSEPGLLNTLLLNVMFICSVSTALLNGNPLLRFDGYYVLSDLLEVPNLQQRSQALLRRTLTLLCLGAELPSDRALVEGRRGVLWTYAVASVVYRWFIVLAILWFCYRVLKQHHLEVFAVALAAAVLIPMIVAPLIGIAAALRNPWWKQNVRKGRGAFSVLFISAALVLFCLLPLPFNVPATVVMEASDARYVYVSRAGRLVDSIEPGATVHQGEPLARLVNRDLDLELARLVGQRDEQRTFLKTLEIRRFDEPQAAASIPAATEALADLNKRVETLRRERDELTICAPIDGTVIPPPTIDAPPAPGELTGWMGTPLDANNHNCLLETGTLFCLIGDPRRTEAMLVIDQSDIEFVGQGQRVKIQLDQSPGEVLHGTVTELARTQLDLAPRELAAENRVPVQRKPDGAARPLQTLYQARVKLDTTPQTSLIGARGRAKIAAQSQTLAQRVVRFLASTFRFEI